MKYKKTLNNNIYTFTDIESGKEINFECHSDTEGYDMLYVNESYSIDFIKYVSKELIKTNDLLAIKVEYPCKELEDFYANMGILVSYYQYRIKPKMSKLVNEYQILDELNLESKRYFLNELNRHTIENNSYYKWPENDLEVKDNIFNMNNTLYRIYKQNNRVVGMASFQRYKDQPGMIYTRDYNNTYNTTCILNIVGKDKIIYKDILSDLLNYYNDDIIISISYPEKELIDIVGNMNSNFDFCFYMKNI